MTGSIRRRFPTRIALLGILAAVALPALAAGPVAANREAAAASQYQALARFHPAPLPGDWRDTVEDREVWLAKLAGLAEGAPSLLRQSLLMSQTRQEFQGNVALLGQMRQGLLQQAVDDHRTAATRTAGVRKEIGVNDLAYRPIPPCRIVDSRAAITGNSMQGPIAGNTLRNFLIYVSAGGNFAAQGGSNSNCGVPDTATIDAAAFVVTVLAPNFDAFLGIADQASLPTVLSNVAVNFTRNQGISTMYIARAFNDNNMYLAMPAGLLANVVIDLVGYFIVSGASPLDCTTVIGSNSNVPAGPPASFTQVDSSCPVGYTSTGGGANTTATVSQFEFLRNIQFPIPTGGNGWRVLWTNYGGSSVSVNTWARCCRVPGGNF